MRGVAEVIGENEIILSIDLYFPGTFCSGIWTYESWLYEG